MSDLGERNLKTALARHTRDILEDNWQVASGATTSVLPCTLSNPSGTAIGLTGGVQTRLQGSICEFTSGVNVGQSAVVSSVSADGTITLDADLPNAPATGDTFVLVKSVTVSVDAAENIAEVGGTGQTGADWTPLFQAVANASNGADSTPPTNALYTSNYPVSVATEAYGTAVTAGTGILATDYDVPANGTVNVTVGLETSATATTFEVTLDGTNYLSLNAGNNLTLGAMYAFSVGVLAGDKINFTTAADTTLAVLRAAFVVGQ